jgi:FtsZ-binding cell division protein ZapB
MCDNRESRMDLNIKDIRIDGGTQSRNKINTEVIGNYVECYENGDRFPPVEVFHDGISYYLVNGFHRYFMYKKLNIPIVEAKIYKGTIRDAQKFCLGVNDDHGLQRTNADKRKAVKIALDDMEWSEYSDREIAKICKVSSAFVGKVRKDSNVERPAVKKVTKNGKKTTVDTTNIGKKEDNKPTEEYDPTEDEMKNLVNVNEELHQENLTLKDTKMVVSEDKQVVLDELTELRKQIKLLESEIQVVKNSRDQYQNKCAELIKQNDYLRRQNDKLKKQG